ncbi:MAG TPA: hypothetical protein EYP69_04390, partial [Bacteroidales bacterium]|nr:hypothetical protein [Bacteroidales bacterium]
MNFDIEKWVESIRKNGEELLSFSGQITSDIISEYIEKVEAVAHRMALPRSFEKKMVHILVESLQNLFHHSYACSANKNLKNFGAFILYIKNSFPKALTLAGKRVVIDCANGAGYIVGPTI